MSRLLQAVASFVVVGALVALVVVARGGAKTESQQTSDAAGAGAAAQTPTSTAAAAAEVDPVPLTPALPVLELPGCKMYVSTLDEIAETVEMVTPGSLLVAIATVTDVGPAQWNTPDGAPPESDEDYDAMHVMRLVRLDVDRAFKGSPAAPLTIWVQGGKIGCSEFITSAAPRAIDKGDQFALFLDWAPPQAGTKGVLHSIAIWPVTANGIQSPGEGVISADRFATLAAAAVAN